MIEIITIDILKSRHSDKKYKNMFIFIYVDENFDDEYYVSDMIEETEREILEDGFLIPKDTVTYLMKKPADDKIDRFIEEVDGCGSIYSLPTYLFDGSNEELLNIIKEYCGGCILFRLNEENMDSFSVQLSNHLSDNSISNLWFTIYDYNI